jgi:hypothetical protein
MYHFHSKDKTPQPKSTANVRVAGNSETYLAGKHLQGRRKNRGEKRRDREKYY